MNPEENKQSPTHKAIMARIKDEQEPTYVVDRPPYCPLFTQAFGRYVSCLRDRCAWWSDDDALSNGRCALPEIAYRA